MKYLDQTGSDPAENLALDEALLDACEGDPSEAVLRVFEPQQVYVVVGYGNARAAEVDLSACEAARIPVLRRTSGGGTVVLGPGCLAYSLVLPMGWDPALESVTGTNTWIMERQRGVLARVLGEPVEVQGFTDLVWRGRKVSGNAQRRRSRTVLFHGTFLLSMDLTWIARCLRMPTHRPAYRADRSHEAFVANLGVGLEPMKSALREGWRAEGDHGGVAAGRIRAWMEEKFGKPGWHARR
ncbi:MAG: lipoate--protein ligase family protein [Verrucomicrobiales bacterium]|nr:lipoate--protein ligase family protein [Verrucomicrobiales bacterium]